MDFLTIFIRPPGDLLYFLIAVALCLACWVITVGQRLRYADDAVSQQYHLATLGAVMSWALLLLGALVTLLLSVEARAVLPPLERAANVLWVLFLTWVFLAVMPARAGRLGVVVLVLSVVAVIIAYVLTATQWMHLSAVSTVGFNTSSLGVAWTVAAFILVVAAGGASLVFFRQVVDAPLKFVFFLTLAFGYGVTLYQQYTGALSGDYAGVVRLSVVAASMIALVLIFRAMMSRFEAVVLSQSQAMPVFSDSESIKIGVSAVANDVPNGANNTPKQDPVIPHPASPIERESVQLLRALGLMLEDATPELVPQQVVQVMLDVLRADVGAMLRLKDANYADINAVYDRFMQRTNQGISLNLDQQPTLVNAIERRVQRPLLVERNRDELNDLYTRLEISQMGPAYFQPLIHDQTVIGVLLVALPYTSRELTLNEEELLKGVAVIASGLLALAYRAEEVSQLAEERAIQAMVQGVSPSFVSDQQIVNAREEMQANLQLAREQINDLSQQVVQLKLALDRERHRIASTLGDSQDGLSISQRIVAIHSEQAQLRSERDQLMTRLQEAEAVISGAGAADDGEVVDQMIAVLRREREDLIEQRDRLRAQLEDLQRTDADGMVVPESLQEVLERMSDEKARLQLDRDALSTRLDDLQTQLSVLGVEGSASGLAYLIGKLYEDRSLLRAKNDTLTAERNLLLKERQTLEERIQQEKAREKLISTLQEQLKHLAADRDVAIRQRDQLRSENHENAAKLDSVKQHRARLLAQVSGYEIELKEAHDAQAKLHREIERIANRQSDLLHERDNLLAESQTLQAYHADGTPVQSESAQATSGLKAMVEELTAQRSQLERELQQLRGTLAAAQNQIEALEMRAGGVYQPPVSAYTTENSDVVMGLVQELRTPMTSISGYVELLMAESAGILGEMQRQFLQRVVSNVTRLSSMLEDLVRITALDTGRFTLSPVPLDVMAVIEDAITNASMQFREKGLTVNLELDVNLPPLRADHDAFRQMIGQLLTNAYLVTPPDTAISVKAMARRFRFPERGEVNCLHVAVADQGGGIMPEDEARVFARKYKAENPLIQGLGDTGVGMAIAKALVEAHGGHLWLENVPNVGAVFNFVLPLEQ